MNPARDRIIKAAGKLFHAEGIRAVSVDAVAEMAGITKRTAQQRNGATRERHERVDGNEMALTITTRLFTVRHPEQYW